MLLEKHFNGDDMLRTIVWRRVSPLQMRGHKICHMSGQLDPTRMSRHILNKGDVMKRVKAIASSEMEEEWNWNVKPFHRNRRAPRVNQQTI